MLITKKKKIRSYLQALSAKEQTAFDSLLADYLAGKLKSDIGSLGINQTGIHIDWLDDIKCIGIQGRYHKYYMDLQIEPDEFNVSFDRIEPDDGTVYPLESKEQFYAILSKTIQSLT